MDTQKLKENLAKLSKCKALPESDLKGRYRKSFHNLKVEIKVDAEQYLKHVSLDKIIFTSVEPADEINSFVASDPGKAIMKEIKNALYKDCSFEEFHAACLKMREQVKHIAWKYAPPGTKSIEM